MVKVSSVESLYKTCGLADEISNELESSNVKLLQFLQEKYNETHLEVLKSTEFVAQATAKVASLQSEIATLVAGLPETAAALAQKEAELEVALQNLDLMQKRLTLSNELLQKVIEFIESTTNKIQDSKNRFNTNKEELNTRLSSACRALESYLNKSFDKNSKEYKNQKSQAYEYAKTLYKQGKVTKADVIRAYKEKLESRKDNFIKSSTSNECGVKMSEYNLPIFDYTFCVELNIDDFSKERGAHDRIANATLKKEIQNNPSLKNGFNQRQIEQIENGITPDGYTWHHDGNPPPGKLQLVKSDIHEQVRHTGGYSLWCERK